MDSLLPLREFIFNTVNHKTYNQGAYAYDPFQISRSGAAGLQDIQVENGAISPEVRAGKRQVSFW
jgi:hypothetical protein